MGTTERKRLEREQREQLFLDQAEKMLTAESFMQLHMAKLAKSCHYATGTLYQHFSSREDLLVALATRHSQAHLALFEKVAAWHASSRDKMFALSVVGRHFVQHNARYAKLAQYVYTEAVWEHASAARREQILQAGQPISRIVCAIVQQAIDLGELPTGGASAMELAMAPWALCEGNHALEQTQGLLEAFAIPRDSMQLYRHMQMLLNGMGWQPLADVYNEQQLQALVQRISTELLS